MLPFVNTKITICKWEATPRSSVLSNVIADGRREPGVPAGYDCILINSILGHRFRAVKAWSKSYRYSPLNRLLVPLVMLIFTFLQGQEGACGDFD